MKWDCGNISYFAGGGGMASEAGRWDVVIEVGRGCSSEVGGLCSDLSGRGMW